VVVVAGKVVSVRLAAEVAGFTAGMSKAKASVDDLTRASKVTQKEAFEKMADKAALAGAGVAAGLGVAIAKFADFDQTMSAVKANTGAAGEELDSLRQIAMDLGADTVFSATEAADAINEMAKAGVATADILGGGLKGALDLAAAGQLEVGRAGEIAATTMNQFGLEGKDVVRIADTLAAGANKAMGSVEDLAVGLSQVGPVANSMGWSIEETTGALAMFAQSGLVGEKGGTALRGVLMSLTGPSKAAAEEMEHLGIQMYDAQGKTLGAAAMAQQLQDALKGLPDAERNAAMARIFGNVSMGAATVLMQGGATAAKEWEAAVTESGFAAEQAATLTDNLKGDIEELGGALDTVFIQTGGAANDGLRTLVQGMTTAVDVISEIPGAVLLGGGALTSLALLAPKGILKWREYKEQLDTLGLSMDKISTKAPKLGMALRGIGAAATLTALASVATAIAKVSAEAQVADVTVEDLAGSLEQLSAGGRLSGAIADIFRDEGGMLRATEQFVMADEAIERFATTAQYVLSDSVYDNIVRFLQPMDANEPMFDKQVEQIDQALAQMVAGGNIEQAKAALDSLLSGIDDPQVAERTRERFVRYAEEIKNTGDQAKTTAEDTSALVQKTADLEQTAEDAEKALKELNKAILGLGSPVIEQREATRAYEESVDNFQETLSKQVEELGKARLATLGITKPTKAAIAEAEKWAAAQIASGKALDVSEDSGRKLSRALDDIQQKTLAKVWGDYQLIESTQGTEAAIKAGEKAMKNGRDEFIKAARDAGLTEKAAKKLADQIELIPENVRIKVEETGAESADAKIAWAARDREATIKVREEIERANVIRSRGAGPTGVTARAEGGPIWGPGTSTSDSIPLWASDGEFMQKAKAVDHYGLAFMHAVNNLQYPKNLARGYAGGGEIRPQYAPMTSFTAPAALAIDPELIGAAVARHMPPMVSVQSGKDARQAAEDAIRDWEWRRDG
jgi:TP901 family phage tail tape measure protein